MVLSYAAQTAFEQLTWSAKPRRFYEWRCVPPSEQVRPGNPPPLLSDKWLLGPVAGMYQRSRLTSLGYCTEHLAKNTIRGLAETVDGCSKPGRQFGSIGRLHMEV